MTPCEKRVLELEQTVAGMTVIQDATSRALEDMIKVVSRQHATLVKTTPYLQELLALRLDLETLRQGWCHESCGLSGHHLSGCAAMKSRLCEDE